MKVQTKAKQLLKTVFLEIEIFVTQKLMSLMHYFFHLHSYCRAARAYASIMHDRHIRI